MLDTDKEIELMTDIITNPEDRCDCQQYLNMELLKYKTIYKFKILVRFLNSRFNRWLQTHKAQGLTFNGRPTIYEKANHNHLPKPEYVKLPKQLADNRVISSKKKVRKLVIWIIETWLKQC